MNIFCINSAGHITDNDDVAIFMQSITAKDARDIVRLLAMATRGDVRFMHVGTDPETGRAISDTDGVYTYAEHLADVDRLKAKSPKF